MPFVSLPLGDLDYKRLQHQTEVRYRYRANWHAPYCNFLLQTAGLLVGAFKELPILSQSLAPGP